MNIGGRMKRLLAIAGICVLGAGILHAAGTSSISEIFVQAITETRGCEVSSGSQANDEKEVMEKIANRDPRYMRAINALKGFIEDADGERRITAGLTEEIPYNRWGFTVVKLRMLDVTFEQRRASDKWLPTFLEIEIKYWRGLGPLGAVVHNKYKISFKCDAP